MILLACDVEIQDAAFECDSKIIFDALKGNSDPRGQHYWGDPAKVTRIQNGISVPCEATGEQTNTCIGSICQEHH